MPLPTDNLVVRPVYFHETGSPYDG